MPLEVTQGNESLDYILQTGIVGHFVFEQLDRNPKGFKGLNMGQFECKMQNDTFYIKQFEKYLLKEGIDINLNKNTELVNRYISAEFARQLFGENQYYQILLNGDTMIKAVLKK